MDEPMSAMEQAKQNESARQALVPTLIQSTTEIAPTAGAAQVQAMVQARFIMALKKPRNMTLVRQMLKKECERPSFALESKPGEGNSALYRRPVGGNAFAEGLGIRFAEVAELCMGNIMSGSMTIAEDEEKKTKYCFVLDLETNNSWEDTVDIYKYVERKKPREGDVIISKRVNSVGQEVYKIAANEDSLRTKEGAEISKKLRTLILRLIPGDLKDQCIQAIKDTRLKGVTENPDAAKNAVVDGMYMLNVNVTMLEEFLEHPIDQISPTEIVNLQGIWSAIAAGETTWAEIMANKDEAKKIQPKQKTVEATPDRGMDAAKAAEANNAPVQTPPAQTTQAPTQPAQPQEQPKPVETPTETPAQTQQTVPPPVQPPPAQPPQTAAATPPAWAQVPQTEPPQTAPAPPPVTQAVGPNWQVSQNGVAVLIGIEPPGGLGKPIKNVQFPARMTKENETEACTPEQLGRAQTALAALNERMGKSFVLESTVKNWFQCDLSQINGYSLECVIRVIETWQ